MDLFPQCPHCRASHVQISPNYFCEWGESGNRTFACVAKCSNTACKRVIFFLSDKNPQHSPQPKNFGFIYPCSTGTLPQELELPANVRKEFSEAADCLQFGSVLASMTMSRRVLQRCLKAQGFDQKVLAQQIDAAKADGTIPNRYHDLADEVRMYGNIGAHPDDDNASLVTSENANQLLEFVRILIEEFYVLPLRAKALQSNRLGN